MNRIKKYSVLLFFILGFAFSKNTYTISGSVKNEAGDIVKKGSVILVKKQDGSEIKKTKINRKGEFKIKKIQTGKYQINVDAEGKGSLNVDVMDGDVKNLIVTLINNAPEKDDSIEMATINETIQGEDTSTLNTPLKTKTAEHLLPQVRAFDQVDKLQFEDQFFEYESNLRVLKNQIDSLKSIVTAFEKKQTMPNVSREILDLIKVPNFHDGLNQQEEEDVDLEEVIKALTEDEVSESAEEVETLKGDLKEHRKVVKYLREKLNEVNLLNAKLLFTNKLFRAFGMNNEQKMKVVETFDRAKTLREIKLVYATVAENFGNENIKPIKETKGSASKAVASTKSEKQEEIISEGSDVKARFQKLANIL